MAVRAVKGGDQIKASALPNGEAAEVLDIAVKDLIDNLIVPKLVEEFLRQYCPASVVEHEQFGTRNSLFQPDSELNSTP